MYRSKRPEGSAGPLRQGSNGAIKVQLDSFVRWLETKRRGAKTEATTTEHRSDRVYDAHNDGRQVNCRDAFRHRRRAGSTTVVTHHVATRNTGPDLGGGQTKQLPRGLHN